MPFQRLTHLPAELGGHVPSATTRAVSGIARPVAAGQPFRAMPAETAGQGAGGCAGGCGCGAACAGRGLPPGVIEGTPGGVVAAPAVPYGFRLIPAAPLPDGVRDVTPGQPAEVGDVRHLKSVHDVTSYSYSSIGCDCKSQQAADDWSSPHERYFLDRMPLIRCGWERPTGVPLDLRGELVPPIPRIPPLPGVRIEDVPGWSVVERTNPAWSFPRFGLPTRCLYGAASADWWDITEDLFNCVNDVFRSCNRRFPPPGYSVPLEGAAFSSPADLGRQGVSYDANWVACVWQPLEACLIRFQPPFLSMELAMGDPVLQPYVVQLIDASIGSYRTTVQIFRVVESIVLPHFGRYLTSTHVPIWDCLVGPTLPLHYPEFPRF